jgi:hypothetical protein
MRVVDLSAGSPFLSDLAYRADKIVEVLGVLWQIHKLSHRVILAHGHERTEQAERPITPLA